VSRELPSLNALRAFEATARLSSVSRAAEELHVTHGAISRQVRVLEEALDQSLFVRHGRGVALTAAGEQLRDRVAGAFDQLRDGWSELQRSRAERPFVLGCASSLLARWVIPRLDRLERDLPSLKLHLSPEEDPLAPQHAELDAALALARLFYLLEAAVAGLGVAIAPAQLVQDDVKAGRLLAPWGFRQTQARWILATPRRRNDTRVEALATWLRNALLDA
jgi:DNA-binding transcriptional LysR family regulator